MKRKHQSSTQPTDALARLGNGMKRDSIKRQVEELRRILIASRFVIDNIDGELFGFDSDETKGIADIPHESVDDILEEAIRMAKNQLVVLRSIRNGIDGRDEEDEDDDRNDA